MNTKTYTYQARITVNECLDSYLTSYADLMSTTERKLFADICRGHNPNKLKSSYLVKYGITARQFNAINIFLKGKIASIKELNKTHLSELQTRIKKTVKCIKSLIRRKTKTIRQANKLHQKQRLLASQQHKLSQLQQDLKDDKARICFGSKRLFNKQFHLDDNGYNSHQEWKQDWINSRSRQFSLVGSKDEAAGNQSCIANIETDSSISLKLRLPNALHGDAKFITIPGIGLNYGLRDIMAAINENSERNVLKSRQQQAIHGERYKLYGQAISYRFLKDAKGWRVFITVDKKAPKIITKKQLGTIGVDLNQHHLAVTATDRAGNPIDAFNIPLVTYGKTSNQTKAIVGDAVKQLVDYAVKTQKPLVIEDLNFHNKKASLEQNSPKYARMLSSLAYNLTIQTIKSRGFRHGVEVFTVNPAYSSIIGRVKFAKRYGLNIHNAAALVIARRIMNFSEKLPRTLDNIPNGHGGHVTLHGLVKNHARHVWSTWAKVLKMFKAAHAAQYQNDHRAVIASAMTGSTPANMAGEVPF